jgi:hypothetical protein
MDEALSELGQLKSEKRLFGGILNREATALIPDRMQKISQEVNIALRRQQAAQQQFRDLQ